MDKWKWTVKAFVKSEWIVLGSVLASTYDEAWDKAKEKFPGQQIDELVPESFLLD